MVISFRMKLLIQLVVLLLTSVIAEQGINLKQVKCLVCRATVDEFKDEVKNIDPKKRIEIGQYKIDHKGDAIQKSVPLSESEVHLSSMLESICKKMDDYVRATYKSNGKLTLMKLMVNNHMNPLMSEVDIVQDGDLNKSLEYFCTEIVNENEDAFIDSILNKDKNAKSKICTEEARYCEDFDDASDGDDDTDETETTQEDDYDLDAKDEL